MEKERETQDRVVKFFQEELGYDYLGSYGTDNQNIEQKLLGKYLKEQNKYDAETINKAILELAKCAGNQQKSLYDINKEVYAMLRYGIEIKNLGEVSKHIHFIDWKSPNNNHFAIAEEVTVKGTHDARPDIVLYINGIAFGVIELKKASKSVANGIRQNIANQSKDNIQRFFTTQQLVMAGNDSEGLRYGTIGTPEKYYLIWKEENPEYNHNIVTDLKRTFNRDSCEVSKELLDSDIYRFLNKERVIDFLHNFVIFDSGTKKLARHNQYFGVKKSQEKLKEREGGIIFHTQGSGKSLTMVWLSKWIRENIDDSRVVIITDRTELDEQIEKIFLGVDENIYRTKSGRDLIEQLNKKDKNLISSLVHKFGRDENDNCSDYIKDLKSNLSNFEARGNLYIFVDECHRTQSGKLHNAMKDILPNAIFLGFTGTPLLKKDKQTSVETFGKFIHSYRLNEATEDKVILDLRYEARRIDIHLGSEKRVDAWFASKTEGLSDIAQAELKKRWGTMQKIVSSKSKLERIVKDIIFDFEILPRLKSGRGNAMLVAGSIYEACKYYELFYSLGFAKCAIVTSYNPNIQKIKGEETGEEQKSENIKKYTVYKKMIANYFNITEEEAETDARIAEFEKDVKKKFIDEPGQMKLLIVVDKLLTGFDAPSATNLYIDKPMKDHGLFQAICRVNRLDGHDNEDELDKEYGFIIDYRDLFFSVESAINDYTQGAFEEFAEEDVSGLVKDRIKEGKKRLDEVLEQIKALTEGVKAPRNTVNYFEYFVGDNPKEKEQERVLFYKTVSALVRAFMNIKGEMKKAGYSAEEEKEIANDVKNFTELRDAIKLKSGDYLDLKRFNPAMRSLIDSYVEADESKVITSFVNNSLIDIIALNGIDSAIDKLPKSIKENKKLAAETIENNMRKLIVDQRDINPAYYDNISKILSDLIEKRKEGINDDEKHLQELEKVVKDYRGEISGENSKYPERIKGSFARQALFDNLNNNEELAVALDEIIRVNKPDEFRKTKQKQRKLKSAIAKKLEDASLTDKIFEIVLKQDEY